MLFINKYKLNYYRVIYMSYKGRFKPKQYKKYKGDPTKIVYRSMWELRFMKYCDKNPYILEWSKNTRYVTTNVLNTLVVI